MERAYFAGGEPLVIEEHYQLLEEMIRQGRTDIKLIYNTNLTNLEFKNRDIIKLWSHFKEVDVSASVDHYGRRAEYMRHGTNWLQLEENIRRLREVRQIRYFRLHTVVSVFNILSLPEFYLYLMDNELYMAGDNIYSSLVLTGPEYLSVLILPLELREQARQRLQKLITVMSLERFRPVHIDYITRILTYLDTPRVMDEQRELFFKETDRIDKLRGESFPDVFPELSDFYQKYHP